MNQSPSIANSINTYNPQSFSSSGLNGPTSNIQNNSLNGKDLKGRSIIVNEARPQEDRPKRHDFNNNNRQRY